MSQSSSGLYSHPNKYLEHHLSSVISIAQTLSNKIPIEQELKNTLNIICFSHDIGKATSYFQDYIKGNKELKNKKETKHSLLGGVIGFYIASKFTEDKFLKLLCYVLPKRHHSDLVDFLDDINDLTSENEKEILKKQINSIINNEKFEICLQNLQPYSNFELLRNFDLREINLESLSENLIELKSFLRNLNSEKSLDYYIDTLLLFSLLLDADKSDVGIKGSKDVVFEEVNLEESIVDKFISEIQKQRDENYIIELRNQAYEDICKKDIDINQKIYTLTLPTGLGKTLLSLKMALKIANKVKKEKDVDLKIIYSLPFLSIIEQNFDVFERLLKHNDIEPSTNILLKHHHLTDFKYTKEDEEFDFDSSRILIEGWNSKIIVTTFMQFFYSLISNKNRMLRKFNKFTNAVIILDEIQSIPHKYWLLLKEVLLAMSKRFNFYVILSTATQPLIFEEGKYIELIEDKSYFEKLNRYNVYIDKSQKTIEQFYDSIKIENDKSYLFIFNTINSAKQFYELLKNKLKEKDEITFLSTHIVPKERLKRITQIKNKQKRIVVSTQLVEAGVDIDFDVVYRDFAPLDSLIQSAGRCNREGKKEKGLFHVLNLKDEKNNRMFWNYVYDQILINITFDILKKDAYEEKDIISLSKEYFEEISKRKSDYESSKLLEMLYTLKFSGEKERNKINSIQDFALIEEDYYKQNVFIELDEDAKKIWKEYKNIWSIKDVFERKKAFENLKADFYQYVISVPIKDNIPPEEYGFYYVCENMINKYYSLETGFIIRGDLF